MIYYTLTTILSLLNWNICIKKLNLNKLHKYINKKFENITGESPQIIEESGIKKYIYSNRDINCIIQLLQSIDIRIFYKSNLPKRKRNRKRNRKSKNPKVTYITIYHKKPIKYIKVQFR